MVFSWHSCAQAKLVDTTLNIPAQRDAIIEANQRSTNVSDLEAKLKSQGMIVRAMPIGVNGSGTCPGAESRSCSKYLGSESPGICSARSGLRPHSCYLDCSWLARSLVRWKAWSQPPRRWFKAIINDASNPSPIRELNDLARMVNHLAQDLEIQLAKLGRLAYRDVVSNLPNRALFMERLGKALAASRSAATFGSCDVPRPG